MRSRSPSPSKSAARASAVRGRPRRSGRFSNSAGAVWRSQATLPFSWSRGQELPEVGDQEVLPAVLVEVDHLRVGGVGDWRSGSELARRRDGVAEEDHPAPHVAGHDLDLAVPVEVAELHVRRPPARGGAGRVVGVLREDEPALRPGATGRAAARTSGARDSKHWMNFSRSICQSRLSSPGADAGAGHAALGHLLDPEAPLAPGHVLRGGRTWHFVHCCLTVSPKAASGRSSGLPSSPRTTPWGA